MFGFELADHVDEESLEHLAYHLVRTLDEDLLWPPILLRHVIQEPLTTNSIKHISDLAFCAQNI